MTKAIIPILIAVFLTTSIFAAYGPGGYSAPSSSSGSSSSSGGSSGGGGGGGGGATAAAVVTCTENWECGDWFPCGSDNSQFRTCKDLNACGTTNTRPFLEQVCIYDGPAVEQAAVEQPTETPVVDWETGEVQDDIVQAPITGAATAETGGFSAAVWIPLILGVLAVLITAILHYHHHHTPRRRRRF